MAANEDCSKIVGDPTRQATDTIRGFVHQLWHSVHAWLDLGDDELLFLEGAEDFDVVQGNEGIVTQVKATAANITLRSADVIESIENFWDILQRNSGRDVRYRLITTASVGFEKGKPFSAGIAGLHLWRQCERDEKAVEELRAFFVKEKCFKEDLTKFIETAPAAELSGKLFSRISWDTDQEDTGAVQDAVKRKLVYHGDRMTIPPSHSEKVASRLFSEVATLAGMKTPRRLDRVNFLELFEKETCISVPFAQQQAGIQALAQRFTQSATCSFLTEAPGSLIQTAAPPLPVVLASRNVLEADLKQLVAKTGLLVLHGSTGMGKTIFASLATRGEPTFVWANLRGLNGNQIAAVFRQLSRTLDADTTLKRLVLDDLDVLPEQTRQYEHFFAGLIYTALARGGQVIVTSQKRLPPNLLRYFDLQGDPNFSVPRFEDGEIQKFAIELGCPSDLATLWGKAISLQTAGHPQLVHARLLTLARSGWPAISAQDFIETPSDVSQERTQSRMLLTQTPEGATQLLYRLSLVEGGFRRDHAIAIGEIPPEIQMAGDAFDRLTGPWIEPVNDRYFRLSPLLSNAAIEAWSTEKVKSIRESVGKAIFKSGKLTNIEASTILMQGLLSRSEELLSKIGYALLMQGGPMDARFGESLSWILCLKTQPGIPIFPENSTVNWMLRSIQFHVAVAMQSENMAEIVDCLDAETTFNSMGENYLIPRFLFSSQAIFMFQAKLKAGTLLRLLAETLRLQKELIKAGEKTVAEGFGALKNQLGADFDPVNFLFIAISMRCNNAQFLDELIETLRVATEEVRDRFRLYFASTGSEARLLVDKAWCGDDKGDQSDWEYSISAMERAAAFGSEFAVPNLVEAAVRAIVIICDEYLHDQDRAHQVLETMGCHISSPSPLYLDEQANLLLNEMRYDEALAIWDAILPQWKVENNISVVFAYRKAGIAAGRSELWEKAAQLFRDGAVKADAIERSALSAGMLADSGFALWKSGKNEEAISVFIDVLSRIDVMPNTKDDVASFKLRKTVGQTLLHVQYATRGDEGESTNALPVGACSDPGVQEKLLELPLTHSDMTWLTLAQAELELQLPPRAFKYAATRFSKSQIPVVRWLNTQIELSYKLREGEVDQLPKIAQEHARTFRLLTLSRASGGTGLEELDDSVFQTPANREDSQTAVEVLVVAMISLAAQGKLNPERPSVWAANSDGLPIESNLVTWLNEVRNTLSLETAEAVKVMISGTEPGGKRVLASLRLLTDESIDIDDLFHAQIMILLAVAANTLRNAVSDQLSSLFTRQWRERIRFRATLRSPGISIPTIETACADPCRGIQKTSRILLAASGAVSIRLPEHIRQKLRELAQSFLD